MEINSLFLDESKNIEYKREIVIYIKPLVAMKLMIPKQ